MKYKDSGVEWLGEVPEKWAIVRLKDLGFLQNGVSKGGDYFGSGFPFVSYGNVYNDTVSSTKIKTFANSTPEDQRAYSCKSGDVFFTRTSETIEEIGFSATCLKTIPKSVFSGFVIRFRPTTNKLVPGFSNFYFSARVLRSFFSKEIALVTRASLGQGLLNKLSVILPSASEQRSIADYLDTKTAQIDRRIELLSQKAEKYGKLKQSLINETVTRGLDKSVPMKDSGIEWIGDVPDSWLLNRHKDNFELLSDRCEKTDCLKVGLENIEGKTGKFIPTDSEFDGNGIAFKKGDILFGKLRPYLAKVYLAEFIGDAVGDMFVYRPKRTITSPFSKYLMLSDRYIEPIAKLRGLLCYLTTHNKWFCCFYSSLAR